MRQEDWIKVSDRLPEVNPLWEEWNLCRVYYGGSYLLEILRWTGHGWYSQTGERMDQYVSFMVMHWMSIELPVVL